MCSLLDCPPILQDDNVVGFLDGREAMGDSDSRTGFCNSIEGSLNYSLAFSVNRRGGFVQDYDLRVFYNAPGDGETLLLAP
jgi:hypothetical protein